MRLLIIADMFSLESWLIEGKEPHIMPAVYNFYRYLGSHTEHSFYALVPNLEVNKKVEFPNGSVIELVKYPYGNNYLMKAVSIFDLIRKGSRNLSNENYDLVYGMTIYSYTARRIGRKKGLLSVSRIFGSLLYDEWKRGNHFKIYTRFIFQYLELKRPTDLIICTEDGTEFDKALEVYNPGKKAHLLYNGLEKVMRDKLLSLKAITHIDSSQTIKFLSLGRLTAWKRHDLAIGFIEALVQSGLDVELSILGVGEEEEVLKKLVQSKSLGNKVKFLGSEPHRNIPTILADHPVCLFFYDSSTLGNSQWEAALAGRLLINRNTGKTPTVFTHGEDCLMLADEDIPSLVEQFMTMVDHPIQLSTRSRRKVSELIVDWSERFETELDIIQQQLVSETL